jgi:hypothetical protein
MLGSATYARPAGDVSAVRLDIKCKKDTKQKYDEATFGRSGHFWPEAHPAAKHDKKCVS